MVKQAADPDSMSLTFAALADPTRRAILASLATGEASVQDLARPFQMSMPGISKHLKVLEHAGLITRGRNAQWRPCRLRAGPLKEATDWMEQYRRFWEESLNRLEAYLMELQGLKERAKPVGDASPAKSGRKRPGRHARRIVQPPGKRNKGRRS